MAEILYCNGTFGPAGNFIDPSDRGFTLGDGVFDTLLAEDATPIYAIDHFARLARHAGVLEIPLPVPLDQLAAIACHLALQNGYASVPCAIRTTLTRGPSPRGLQLPDNPQPTLLMRAVPVLNRKSEVSAVVARAVRRNEGSPLSQIKSLNYGDQILALQEARRHRADEALMANNDGNLCCATSANLFVLFEDQWLTPRRPDGALDGILRGKILAAGLAREESIHRDRLPEALAVFLTSSVGGIRAVTLLDGKSLPLTSSSKEHLNKFRQAAGL